MKVRVFSLVLFVTLAWAQPKPRYLDKETFIKWKP